MPLRHLAEVRVSNVDKKSVDAEIPVRLCNYTDVYHQDVIDPGTDFMIATATRKQIRAFSLRSGDILFTKDSETPDDIAVPAFVAADLPGVVSGYHLALVRADASRIEPRFLFRVMQSDYVREQFAAAASGVTRYGLTNGAIRGALVPFPVSNIEEQRRIADFLDDHVSQIDDAVALTQMQQQLIVDSNAAWWEGVVRGLKEAHGSDLLRRFADRIEQGSSPLAGGNAAPSGGFGVIKTSSINSGAFVESENKELLGVQDFESRFEVLPGDVLVVRGSGSVDLVADAAWVRSQPSARLMLSDLTYRLVRPRILPGYLTAVLLSHSVRGQIRSLVRQGSGPAKVRAEDVKQLSVPVPPLATQVRIGDEFWDRRVALDARVDLLERRTKLLQERKGSLITAAVTGDFDVTAASGRGVA